MAKEVLGSGFNRQVQEQLKAREHLVSRQQKTDKHLLFFNSNSAWVRLSSSVNTLTPIQVQSLITFGPRNVTPGSNQLANNNILKNGLTKNRNGLKGGIDTTKGYNPTNTGTQSELSEGSKYSQILPDSEKTSTYHNYASLGFRPEPGIQSVSVKSKNKFGTLREAEINATVWTLEDLELVQALYLRPGYSVLLEWGHTLWIDPKNDNEISGRINTFKEFTETKIEQSKIYRTLTEYRNKSSNNYDAMYGYVSNFNWSFRQDGGYDISIKVISRGSILESLATTFEPKGRLKGTEYRYNPSEDSNEDGHIERRSVYHKFAQELGEAEPFRRDIRVEASKYSPSISLGAKYYNKQGLANPNNYAKDFVDQLMDFTYYNLNTKLDGSGSWYWFDEDIVSILVPLRTILDVFNKFITIIDRTENGQDKRVLRFYTGETDADPANGPYERQSKFLTSPHHFSIDPLICILPKAPAKFQHQQQTYYPGTVERSNEFFHKAVEKRIKKGDTDDILNIHVALRPLLEKLQAASEGDKPEKGFLPIMQEFLDQINDTLGGVNQLDIHYDEEENVHYIVDRKLTPTQITEESVINLTGLESTIYNLDISSKISSDIASMVSIAAQGSSGNYKDNVEAMLRWNRGLVDRHTPDRAVTTEDTSPPNTSTNLKDTKAQRLKDFLENTKEVFKDFINNDYDPNKFSELKSYHKEFCNEHVVQKYYEKNNKGNKKPVPGLIPIELSFDTIGIAGLKIGQAFRVSKGILPKKYTDDFGFLITGLDHKIEGNKWITSVKTQFFSIQR